MLEFNDLNIKELNLSAEKYKKLNIIKAKIKLIKKALGVSADFSVHFKVELNCARCFNPFIREFKENFHLEYIAGKDPLLTLEKVELKSGDIERVYYNGPNIDISIGLREVIILAVPLAPLCKNDCLGLCPLCGKNLNNEKCNCPSGKIELFTPKQKK